MVYSLVSYIALNNLRRGRGEVVGHGLFFNDMVNMDNPPTMMVMRK
jgi:hypothetical protein